jgi:hypothetical protein
VENSARNQGRAVAAEGERGGGHFVKHNAEGEEVCALVEFLATQLFRRHIRNGANRSPGAGEMFFRFDLARSCRAWRQKPLLRPSASASPDQSPDAFRVRGIQRVRNLDS